MIPVTKFKDKNVAVFGLGMSGRAAARALAAGGAHAVAWDDMADARDRAQADDIILKNWKDYDWTSLSALVLAPGIPLTHPEPHPIVMAARNNGVEVIGDTELFFLEKEWRGSAARCLVITGTNGKSTTTALTAHVLADAGLQVQLGGNIGRSVLDLEDFSDELVYVIEFSSYQIDLTPTLAADGAALLNISPDHLDRHGTLEHYCAVKAQIFEGLKAPSLAVIGLDTEPTRRIAADLRRRRDVVGISVANEAGAEIQMAEGKVRDRRDGSENGEIDISRIETLQGHHNWQNAAAVYGFAKFLGVENAKIQRGFETFPGLPHRMEFLGRVEGVAIYNDSKATNAEAAQMALGAFDNIYWICGGQAKQGGIQSLVDYFPRVTRAYLIGEAASDFADTLADGADWTVSETLDVAVRAAFEDSRNSNARDPEARDPVLLFSPACASFDQFRNFAIRGDRFCEIVAEVTGLKVERKNLL